MKTITVSIPNETSIHSYPIYIGIDLIGKISSLIKLEQYSKVFIVTDLIIETYLLEKLQSGLSKKSNFLALPTGEKEKNIENVQKIWEALIKAGCDRKSLVINLGGGVVTDMGGFAASTYMRGIDFINIPTTLLSQVDASVGGKTGIDFSEVKNLVGTFNQPKAVIIDTQTLQTLPKREFLSGFAEIIKHGLIQDKNYFEKVTSKHPEEFSKEELIDIIARSCEIKKTVVEADQKEGGMRKILNFGHTMGHAIETQSLDSNTPLLHGEAISIGMIAESKMAELLGMLSESEIEIIRQALISAGLPITVESLVKEKIIRLMQADKKNEKGHINFTLLKGIGQAIYDQDVSEDIIIQAIQFITK